MREGRVYQRKGDDVFVLIDISQGGKCSVIGRKGRGPKEFVGVDVQSIKPVDGGFICMDAGGKEKRISLDGDIEIETASSATFYITVSWIFIHMLMYLLQIKGYILHLTVKPKNPIF